MKKIKLLDRLRTAFKARDEKEFEEGLTAVTDAEAEETEEEKKKRLEKEKEEKKDDESKTLVKVLDSLKALDSRLATLETRDKKAADEAEETEEEKKKREAKEKKDKEEEGKTGDSAALVTEAQDVAARAEILSPGLHMPTFDRKASAQSTRDALCGLKRKALSTAFDGKYRDAITPFLGSSPDFKTLTCDALASAFIGASEIVRRENNAQSTQGTFDGGKAAAGMAQQISAINKKNAEFWARP